MRLFKRANSPYWWMDFTVNGERIRESTHRPLSDQAGANRFMAAEYTRRMNTEQFGEKEDVTLQVAMERTVESVKGSTKTSYRLSMRKWLGLDGFKGVWHLKPDMKLSKLSQADLDDHLAARQREGLAANSINIEVRFIRRVSRFNEARYKTKGGLSFRQLPGVAKTRKVTEKEEAEIIARLKEAEGQSYAKALDLFAFLIGTGVRLSEALALEWSDVNMTRRRIENYNIKTGVETIVPISAAVYDVLERRRDEPKPFAEMSRAVRHLRKLIHEVCNHDERTVRTKGAATIHSLRDTFAGRLSARQMPIQNIGRLLGHKSVKTTMKYAVLEAEEVASEAERLLNGGVRG